MLNSHFEIFKTRQSSISYFQGKQGRSYVKEYTLSLSFIEILDAVQNDQGQLPGLKSFHLHLDLIGV